MEKKKKIPGLEKLKALDEKNRNKGLGRFLVKHWQYLTGVVIVVGWILMNSPVVLSNLIILPEKIREVTSSFKKWYYEDHEWHGIWSTKAEGDLIDLNLSESDVRIEIIMDQGGAGGTIGSPALCKTFPIWDYVQFEGEIKGGKLYGTAWDIIRGMRTSFFTFVVEREGPVLIIKPIDDPLNFLPASTRIGKHYDEKPLEHKKMEEDDRYCAAERKTFFKERPVSSKIRKPVEELSRTLRTNPG